MMALPIMFMEKVFFNTVLLQYTAIVYIELILRDSDINGIAMPSVDS